MPGGMYGKFGDKILKYYQRLKIGIVCSDSSNSCLDVIVNKVAVLLEMRFRIVLLIIKDS
jgi:hypothetical protein